jgi:spore maturation protein CgeB
MRFIIPSYSLPDNFTENVAFTLQNMGHVVLTAPIPTRLIDQRVMHILQLGYEKVAPNWLPPQERWLLKIFREFRPDVMIAITHSVSEGTLLKLNQHGVRNIAWWGDTPANMRKHGLLCKGWDHIFIKDRHAVFKMKTLGLHAHFLPEAMNPLWHKPMYKEIGSDIVFAGNTYDYRHFLIRRLLDAGCQHIKLYGNRPPRWADQDVKQLFQQKFIVKEEKSRVFGEGLACINSTAMTEGNSINCRAFEIAGAGGLQIMEYRPAIEDCFEPGKEIVTYESVDELMDKILFYKDNEGASKAIRQAAHNRVISSHTYQHRLEEILQIMES